MYVCINFSFIFNCKIIQKYFFITQILIFILLNIIKISHVYVTFQIKNNINVSLTHTHKHFFEASK